MSAPEKPRSSGPTPSEANAPLTPKPLGRGDVIAHYRIEREIGRGGMGTVYEVAHGRMSAKRFALKVLGPEVAAHPDAEARFLREAQVVSQLNHPHIVAMVDFGRDRGLAYLVMELLTGEDLASLIQRQALPVDRTADIMLAACSGVFEAHRNGIVHRDIKPQNIFLSRNATGDVVPKVLDFGISKVRQIDGVSSITAASSLVGTPHYLSPELADGSGEPGVAGDQYALGVILYECVTGRRCHEGPTLYAVLHSIAQALYTPASVLQTNLPPGFDDVIRRAMSLRPDARFPSVYELGRALLPFASAKRQALWRDFYLGVTGNSGTFSGVPLTAAPPEIDLPSDQPRVANAAALAPMAQAPVPTKIMSPTLRAAFPLSPRPSSPPSVDFVAAENPSSLAGSQPSRPATPLWKSIAIGTAVGLVVVVGGVSTWIATRGSNPRSAPPASSEMPKAIEPTSPPQQAVAVPPAKAEAVSSPAGQPALPVPTVVAAPVPAAAPETASDAEPKKARHPRRVERNKNGIPLLRP